MTSTEFCPSFYFLTKAGRKALHIQLQILKGQTRSLKWACALLAQDAVRKACWKENQMEIIVLWCYRVQKWNSILIKLAYRYTRLILLVNTMEKMRRMNCHWVILEKWNWNYCEKERIYTWLTPFFCEKSAKFIAINIYLSPILNQPQLTSNCTTTVSVRAWSEQCLLSPSPVLGLCQGMKFQLHFDAEDVGMGTLWVCGPASSQAAHFHPHWTFHLTFDL